MLKKSHLWLGIPVLLAVFALCLVPAGNASAQDDPTLDDALLLMLASQSRLYDDMVASSGRLPGLAAPIPAATNPQSVTPGQINEHRMLSGMFRRFASSMPNDDAVRQEFENKAEEHDDLAMQLARVRQDQYRRGKGFQLFVRGSARRLGQGAVTIGRGIGWVGRGLGKVARVTLIIAKDEVIFRAKQMVRAKLEDLRNLAQGRIEVVWQRIARKLGTPLTDLIRQVVVDPAFIRLRNQFTERLGIDRAEGQAQGAGEDPAEDEYSPDWTNVGPEGETGYDDEATETPTPTPTATPPPPPTATQRPADTPTPTSTPNVTPTPHNFAGSWNSGIACQEAEDAPYTWGITLSQSGDRVTGTLYYHNCPGGGRAYYDVSGTATDSSVLTLHATKTGGRGELGSTALSSFTFTIERGGPPIVQGP